MERTRHITHREVGRPHPLQWAAVRARLLAAGRLACRSSVHGAAAADHKESGGADPEPINARWRSIGAAEPVPRVAGWSPVGPRASDGRGLPRGARLALRCPPDAVRGDEHSD